MRFIACLAPCSSAHHYGKILNSYFYGVLHTYFWKIIFSKIIMIYFRRYSCWKVQFQLMKLFCPILGQISNARKSWRIQFFSVKFSESHFFDDMNKICENKKIWRTSLSKVVKTAWFLQKMALKLWLASFLKVIPWIKKSALFLWFLWFTIYKFCELLESSL